MASTAENALHSPQGDESVKEWVPIPGGKLYEVRWASGDIWTINIHLYVYLYKSAILRNPFRMCLFSGGVYKNSEHQTGYKDQLWWHTCNLEKNDSALTIKYWKNFSVVMEGITHYDG